MKKENTQLVEETKQLKAELLAAELEIKTLKKSNAGLKGTNNERGKKIKDLEWEIHELNTQRQKIEKEFAQVVEKLRKALQENNRLKGNIDAYNELSWIKRIFTKVQN